MVLLKYSMKALSLDTKSSMEEKFPRRITFRARSENQISIWFNQLEWTGSETATALGYKLRSRAGKVLG